MPIITTTTLPAGIVGGAYSEAIVAVTNNLDIQVSRTGPGVLADGSGVDDQGNVDWDQTLVITYTLDNIGDDDLSGISVGVNTTDVGVAPSVTGSPSATLDAAASDTFEITIVLSAGALWSVDVEVTSDADSPKDSYTFTITGQSVDCLFGDPVLPIFKLEPSIMCFAEELPAFAAEIPVVCFNDGFIMSATDVADLVAASEWVIDFGRGTTTAYTTTDDTTPSGDTDDVYSIYPEKTPTGSTAIKLLDSNGSNHGIYHTTGGNIIGGLPVVLLPNSTDGLYEPVDVTDVQQTDNSNYITTTQWWVAWLVRVPSGADTTWRTAIRAEGVPRLYVEYMQDFGSGDQALKLSVDATGGATTVGSVSGPQEIFYGAAFWDGTDLHWWSGSTSRTDQTPGASLNLNALNSTTPVILGNDNNSTTLAVQAWYQGDQLTGGSIAGHIAALQGIVEDFASR